MDAIVIRKLECYGRVGVTAAERAVGQRLLINVVAHCALQRAGQSDALADTISYAALAERIVAIVEQSQFQLLERLAEEIAQQLLAHFPIHELRLQLFKKPPPVALIMEAAGVEIVRRAAP